MHDISEVMFHDISHELSERKALIYELFILMLCKNLDIQFLKKQYVDS